MNDILEQLDDIRSSSSLTDKDSFITPYVSSLISRLDDVVKKRQRKLKYKQNSIYYDKYWSKILQTYVRGAKVRVFKYVNKESKVVNMFTVPFISVEELSSRNIDNELKMLSRMLNSTNYIKDKVIYFEGNPVIDVYYTHTVENINLSKAEMTSVLLHEVGHHTAKISSFILWILTVCKRILSLMRSFCLFLYGALFILLWKVFVTLWLLNILLGLPESLPIRNSEYGSDEVSAKLGLGKELISALKKIQNYDTSMVNKYYGDNILAKLYMFRQTITKFLHISDHPTIEEREKNIQQYNESFILNGITSIQKFIIDSLVKCFVDTKEMNMI